MFRSNLHFVAALVVLGMVRVSALALADEMRVRDVPVPEGATDITYVKRRGDVRFQVTSDFKTVGNYYAKKLTEQRWTKSARDDLQRSFWVQTFSKDKMSLEVRVDSREGGSEVRLTPKGMMWEEDELKAVVDFYRRELPSGEWGEWKENAADAKVEQQTAELAFTGPTGSLIVQLKADGQQVAITLVSRNAQAAKAAGLLPAPGKARLIVGNASEKAAVITINKREYRIAAGTGAEDPPTGLKWDVAPGNYTVGIKQPGEQIQSEKFEARSR